MYFSSSARDPVREKRKSVLLYILLVRKYLWDTYTESQNQLPEGESKFPSLSVPRTITLILKKNYL